MTSSGFKRSVEIERFMRFVRPELQDIALELRSLVMALAPQAEERILWGGLSYHDPNKGGPVKGAICQIELRDDRVRLGFIHGVRLTDKGGHLQGDRISKRYLDIDDFERAPWDAIETLIGQAAALDLEGHGHGSGEDSAR
jgi:hypothetical protein